MTVCFIICVYCLEIDSESCSSVVSSVDCMFLVFIVCVRLLRTYHVVCMYMHFLSECKSI